MHRIFLSLLFLSCLPMAASAACSGTDLRDHLTEVERARLNADVARIPYATGNHWIARKGDTILHLIGTLHLNDPRMAAATERLIPVLEAADAVYLEINSEDMADFESRLARDPSPLMIASGPSLIERLEPQDWDILADALAQRGMPGWMGAKMQPWFLTMTLAIPPCLTLSPDADQGLDKRLREVADRLGLPQYSLETPDLILSIFDSYSMEEQVEALVSLLPTIQAGDDQLATMANAYFEENHAEIFAWAKIYTLSLTGMSEAEYDASWGEIEDRLLRQRNLQWMESLRQITDQIAVVAVGAGHLGGENGLLVMLEQEGFSLERTAF